MAAVNIFPGDMLLKNGGHSSSLRGFYGYDEIPSLTEVNFREIPEPQIHEQEMASEPWQIVTAEDVFPE